MRYASFDWYETPLYYDIIFGERTTEETRFIDNIARQHCEIPVKRILEPACGSARLMVALEKKGYEVSGFDASAGMVAFAKQRLARRHSKADVWQATMQDFRARGKYELAHCFVSTFKYLLSDKDALAHLRLVAQYLRRGGVYVLGLHLTEYHDTSSDHETWHARRGKVDVRCDIDSRPPVRRREQVRSRLTVKVANGDTKRWQTTWHFRTYNVRELQRLLAQVPAFEHIATYDFDYDLESPQDLGVDRLDQVLLLRRV